MGGFPEPVARRIATGELPMDEASRVSRREAQAHPETYIHGSKSGGILEIDPEKSGATNPNARGSGFWGSDNPYQAGTYTGALGEGGTLYPFRVKRGEQIDVDLNGSHWNNIDTEARVTSNGEDFGSIEGWDDTAYDTNDLAFMFQDAGADSLLMRNTIDTAADGNINVVFEEMFPELKKMPHGSKERYEFKKSISKENFQKAKDIANERSARPSNNVAVFDENNIRSPSAAFDPQYTGPNIMGSAALPVAAGLLAAGQSEDADASLASLAAKGLKIDTPDGKLFSVTQRGPEIGPAREIAYAEMEKNGLGGLSARDMAVTPEYRGDGLMGETYDAIEEYTGKNITPSSWLTDDGAKFWEKRDRNKASERGNADPRLLGGVAAGTAVGLAAPMVKDSGFISAPRSEGLMDLTMAARGLERRLEGSPASLLFPEGLVNYLETVNRRTEDPNAMTRIMGLVDLIP
jgi:hypothetical protein